MYESGLIGAKPTRLPLSIGDGELAETADSVVPVPEIFNYWLQPGRIDVGFLGAAQIDRYGNINTTVIGDYDTPKVRLPGAGGAPEIAAMCREVIVIMRQSSARSSNESTSSRPSDSARARATASGSGFPAAVGHGVITDIGVLRPTPVTCELTLTASAPGRVGRRRARGDGLGAPGGGRRAGHGPALG